MIRFLISFQQNKLIAFLVFGLCLGGSIIFAIQPPPEQGRPYYKARGQLSFSNPPPIFTNAGELVQQQGRQVSIETLLAPRTLEAVARRLQLENEELRDIVQKRLKIEFPGPEAQTQLISINYDDPKSQDRANVILTTFMDEMVKHSRLVNSEQLRRRIQNLEERLAKVKLDLAAAEEAFYRYISSVEGSALLAIQDGSLFNGITNSQQQQRQIKLALDEIQGQINSLVEQLGLTPEQAYTSSALSADPIIANLRAQLLQIESQIQLQQKDLRPTHPTMKQLFKQKQANEQLLIQRAKEVIGRDGLFEPLPSEVRQDSNLDPARQDLANQLVTLRTQRQGLLRQLESIKNIERDLKQKYETFPDKQLQQTRLVQEVETKRALYQTILGALVDAQSAEAETTSSLAIAKLPTVQSIVPAPPNLLSPLLIIGAGAGLGTLAAAGVIFLLATLDDRLHTPEELKEALITRELPCLGVLPYVANFDLDGEETAIMLDTNSPYIAYYERVRSNLRRYMPDASKVVLITSIVEGEGKTVTAYNLAIASAQAGKRTLLIEADLRSPSYASIVNVEPDPKAAVQPLQYYGAKGDSIRLVPNIENLYILPSPGPQKQVAAILESSELQRFLEDARGRFDFVVIDTPALSSCNDARLLEDFCDGIVLVTQVGITRGSMLNEAIDQLSEEEAPLVGAVINDLDQIIVVPQLIDRVNVEVEEEYASTS